MYRFLYRQGRPLGVHEVQKGTNIQNPSTAHYHLRKLVDAGLVKDTEAGYVVDRVVFENMVRIGKSLIPIQTTFVAFFATVLFFLLTILRPSQVYAIYALALLLDCVSLGVFAIQAFTTLRKTRA